MATFHTSDPIEVGVEIPSGSIHVIAGDQSETNVVVNPTDPSERADTAAAEKTHVALTDGRLGVRTPKTGGIGGLMGIGRPGSVQITIELPEKSSLDLTTGFGDVRADGRFGDVHVQSGAGAIHVDQVTRARLATGAGSLSLTRSHGDAEVAAGGDMRIERVDGTAEIKNVNGETWIGEVRGRLRVRSANGSIHVVRAHMDLAARTANGKIEVGEVISGSVTLATGSGHIEIGIGEGTSAWVDARTKFGRVDNSLEGTEGPPPGEHVEARARTSFGDISIYRSSIEKNQAGEK